MSMAQRLTAKTRTGAFLHGYALGLITGLFAALFVALLFAVLFAVWK